MDTASPFRRTDIISMIPVYKAALTFHLKPFIRWTPTLFQTTIKTSLKGATPKLVLELMNVKYLTLAHGKGHLQTSPRRTTHFIFLRQTTTAALPSARSSPRTPAEPSSSSSLRRTPPLHQQFKVIKDHTDFKVVEYYRDKGVENWTVECWEKEFSKPQNQKCFKPSSSKTLFIENPLDSLSVSRQHKTKLRYQVGATRVGIFN